MLKLMLKNGQKIFWDFITAPEGVEAALKGYPHVNLEDFFCGDEKLPAARRLDIYANMYFWRIHDAIKEDFPGVVALIGDDKWNDLMTDYLLAHPSDTPLLQYVGKYLPEFLKRHSYAQEWPSLPDLAALEWEKAMMFEAPDRGYLSLADLRAVPSEKWPELKFQFIPAFKIIQNKKIWRKDFVVYEGAMEKEEEDLLAQIGAGKNFADICGWLQSAEKAASYLAGWIEEGILAAIL